MITRKKSSQLKSIAKGRMLGNYGKMIGAFFAMYGIFLAAAIIMMILTGIIAAGVSLTAGLIFFFVIMIGFYLLIPLFMVGQNKMFLTAGRGEYCKFSYLFSGFTICPGKSILAMLLLILISIAVLAVPVIAFGVLTYMSLRTPAYAALGIVIYFAGLIIYYIIALKFALVYYLIIDHPELSVIQLFKTSNRLMKGNKGRFFYITISFIPIMLLGVLSYYIGILFLMPYMQMTFTQFYLNVVEVEKAQQASNAAAYEAMTNYATE
jgi:uncharacterized membrane protein